jgi:hypothetical protein
MKMEMIKPLLWGVVTGAVLTLIVIFSSGLAVTKGSAQEQAEQMTREAVVDKLATICVAKFKKDPKKDQKFNELKETPTWERVDYLKKQGWAKMPGIKKHKYNVYYECADRIVALGE